MYNLIIHIGHAPMNLVREYPNHTGVSWLSTLVALAWVTTAIAEPGQRSLFAPPPVDAVILFGTLTCGEEKSLFVSTTGGAIDWPVEDGALVATPNGRRSNNLVSRYHFRDAELHIEFMLPAEGDGNSGVYVHGEYELQILNSSERRILGDGDMGAIYGIAPPLVNAARGPGVWQAYDIKFCAPRRDAAGKIVESGTISAWLNGQRIHDQMSVGSKTSDYNPYRYDTTDYLAAIARHQRRNMVGPLVLQDHDNPVRFRNIWVKPLDGHGRLYDAAGSDAANQDADSGHAAPACPP